MHPHHTTTQLLLTLLVFTSALVLCACDLDGLSGDLYNPTPATTTLEPLDCQPEHIRCFDPTSYGVCDAQGRIAGIGSCPAQSLCVLGVSTLERPCLPYRNRCEDNEPFSIDQKSLSFKDVQTLKPVQRTLQLRNCGPDRLSFGQPELIGEPTFTLTQPPPAEPLEARQTTPIQVGYNPSITSAQEQGELRIPIFRIDPESRLSVPLTVLRIPLEGREDNTFIPPITSQEFDFGLITTRTTHVRDISLRNTGQQEATFRGILTDPSPEDATDSLRVDWPAFPFTLQPGETVPLRAVYRSETPNTVQITHTLLLDPWPPDQPYPTLTIRAQSTDEGSCHDHPTPSITVATDQEPPIVTAQTTVRPMTPITLSIADEPHSARAYQFLLTRKPRGSATTLHAPEHDFRGPTRTFVPDLQGSYGVTLKTLDDNNTPSCFQSTLTVFAQPESDLHIELFWVSSSYLPHGSGPDLDLVLERSKQSQDPRIPHPSWVDDPYTCFWLNPNPDWGNIGDHIDDCRVLRSDSEGWGPEILEVLTLEERPYTVRVFVRDDRGFGDVFATANVYLDGDLRASYISPGLIKGSTWNVVRVEPGPTTLREINDVTPP